MTTPSHYRTVLRQLLERQELAAEQVRAVMHDFVAGSYSDTEIAALLIAWRMKGETAAEILAAAQVVRQHMVFLETGQVETLDTCGMGGKLASTVNISTATALVVAGADVPVVKHGNRSNTNPTGSADVMTALGLIIRDDLDWVRRCLSDVGLAFCFAPHFHPAWRQVAQVRHRLAVRTIFNCLGPLANPARASYQLLGVSRPELLDPIAGALQHLPIRHALLVSSADGMDEISLGAVTFVRQVTPDGVRSWQWIPDDFGLRQCPASELHVSTPEESAARIREVLDGQDTAAAQFIRANAAAALMAARRVDTLADGVRLADQSITSGRARDVLFGLIRLSKDWAAKQPATSGAPTSARPDANSA